MCPLCGDRGVFAVRYREGEAADYRDVGICVCRRGVHLRARGVEQARAGIAARYGVAVDRVRIAEELLEADELPTVTTMQDEPVDVTEAGRSRKKAKL